MQDAQSDAIIKNGMFLTWGSLLGVDVATFLLVS